MKTGPWSLVLAALWLAAPALAQEEAEAPAKKTGWFDAAELSFVITGGNSQSSTLGLKNKLERKWEKSSFKWKISAVRVETTTLTQTAIQRPPDEIEVIEESTSELTAENYQSAASFERKLSKRLFWRVGSDVLRNQISGIDYRWSGGAGLGHTWFDRKRTRLQTTYGLALTTQRDVVPVEGRDETFLAGRLGWDYRLGLTSTTTFNSVFRIEQNLGDIGDTRLDTTNDVAVRVSDRIALKVSLQLQFTSQPALIEVGVLTDGGDDTGLTVSVPARKLDSFFNIALVFDL